MDGIWIPVSGAIAQQEKVDTIANNLANADTAGFKRDALTFKEYLTALENPDNEVIDIPRKEFSVKDFYRTHGNDKSLVSLDGSFTRYGQGGLRPTGNSLDIAIEGKGFFEVLTPQGVRFSREGRFKIGHNGLLTNSNGHPVLKAVDPALFAENQDLPEGAVAAQPVPPEARMIQLQPQGNIGISNKGEIQQGKELLGQLSVVEFKNLALLKKEGGSLYINPSEENIKGEEKLSIVHQGFLEASNVNALRELSELVKAHRIYEGMNKAIKTYDQMESKSVDLGRVF